MSQQLILRLAIIYPYLNFFLKYITQAYIQSANTLNKEFFIQPPIKLELLNIIILKVIKSLYDVPEANAY